MSFSVSQSRMQNHGRLDAAISNYCCRTVEELEAELIRLNNLPTERIRDFTKFQIKAIELLLKQRRNEHD